MIPKSLICLIQKAAIVKTNYNNLMLPVVKITKMAICEEYEKNFILLIKANGRASARFGKS